MFHNIFKKYSIQWQNAVARYARLLWTNSMTRKADEHYNKQAISFSKQYRYELEKYYAEKNMRVYSGTLDGYVNEWLNKQQALKETLKVVADEKQGNLVKKALSELKDTKDTQAVIDKLYGAKENETIYKIFSFKDNFEKFARQQGDEEAYNLGTGMNEGIIKQYSDRYFWRTQKDKRVRNTHMQLAGKCFLFSDPPTTIDKYGRREAGNPGVIGFGCRCFADPAPEREKPLRGYVVYER